MSIKTNIKSKILIVDDQPNNIQILGGLLRQENYTVGVATNGSQAVKILKEFDDYDLVLMDVNMPVMDGFQACKAIRKMEKYSDIPIIFLTALVNENSIIEGFEAGGQDYVTKPFFSNELLARVKTHLELKSNKDQLKELNLTLEEKVEQRTKELDNAVKKLLKLDASKTEFLRIISHEIRTPLNGIRGAVSVIYEYDMPEEARDLLYILDASSTRLERFALKALDITYFNTTSKNFLRLSELDILDVINFQLQLFQEDAQGKGIRFNLTQKTDKTSTLLDELFINKCFNYIIDNAIKFGDKDSEIQLEVSSNNEFICTTIEDEGAFFPGNYDINHAQPFETEMHVDNNPALSLILCRQIVEAHSGSIIIQNTNKGAFVKVCLPFPRK